MSVEDVEPADAASTSHAAIEQLAVAARPRARRRARATSPRDHGDYLPRSPIVGEASPLSPRLDWEIGDEDGKVVVTGHGTFGARVRRPAELRARRLDRVHVRRDARHREHRVGSSGHDRSPHGALPPPHSPVPRAARAARGSIASRAGASCRARRSGDDDTLTAEADGVFVQPRPELAAQYWGDRAPQ